MVDKIFISNKSQNFCIFNKIDKLSILWKIKFSKKYICEYLLYALNPTN